jgi:hypothetical protein
VSNHRSPARNTQRRSGRSSSQRLVASSKDPTANWRQRLVAWTIDLGLSLVGLLLVAAVADGVASASKLRHPVGAGWLSAGWIATWLILDGIGYLRFGTSIGQHLAHLRFEMQDGHPRRWLWLRMGLVWLSVVTATFPINWLLVLTGHRPLHDRWSHCRLVYKESSL